MSENLEIMELLDARENRAIFQDELQYKFNKTLVVIKANYIGFDKRNVFTNYLVTKAYFIIKKDLNIINYFVSSTNEGFIYYLIVEQTLIDSKKIAIAIENSRMGRLLDIDVYKDGKQLSRTDLNYSLRKCFICDNDAIVCSRNQSHTSKSIINFFNNEIIFDIFNSDSVFENLTIFGLTNELCKPNNFGCVGINSVGSHSDMDKYTFIDTIEVLKDKFRYFDKVDTKSFDELRRFGQSLEQAMFKKTNGVNTYKGAIFSLILIYAGLLNSKKYDDVASAIVELCVNIYNDFDDDSLSESAGKKIFKNHKVAGIRKIAQEGYKEIFEVFEPYYDSNKDITKTFLYIIQNIEDTTIINRKDVQILNDLQNKATCAINDESTWGELECYCIENNISCGGSADLLAITLILNIVKNNYLEFKQNL